MQIVARSKNKTNFVSCFTICDSQAFAVCHNSTARKYHVKSGGYTVGDKMECPYFKCENVVAGLSGKSWAS